MYLSNALRGISSFPQEPEPALVLPIAFCLTSIRIVRSETRMITEHSFIVSISVSFFNSISAFAFFNFFRSLNEFRNQFAESVNELCFFARTHYHLANHLLS